ncbi:MAG: glycosyl transferase, partial [Micrococcus sp.]|nr:glycosyl transferase [Micrococcus sp.]
MTSAHPIATDAPRILLYGDVDLNVVDGSAIWLQSMAETLSRLGACVDVQLKALERRDLLTAPLRGLPGVRVLPARPRRRATSMTPGVAVSVLGELIESEVYDVVIVRGIHACTAAAQGRLAPGRLWSYVTEFGYPHAGRDADLQIRLSQIADASRLMLAQTEDARAVLEALVPAAAGKTVVLSPMIPDVATVRDTAAALGGPTPPQTDGSALQLIYTGKFAYDWRTDRMPQLLPALHALGVRAELTMIGDKVHREPAHRGWSEAMAAVLSDPPAGLRAPGAVSREEALRHTAQADVSLGWRDPRLDLSLEISTKVLESCALGVPPVLNRTVLHEALLGQSYPLFIEADRDTASDIAERIAAARPALPALADHVRHAAAPYSVAARAKVVGRWLERVGVSAGDAAPLTSAATATPSPRRRVLLAGHDFKFAGELVDLLRDDPRVELRWDVWDSLHHHDADASQRLLDWADVVVCEWAGPNAVWYSRRKRPGQRLIVRLHMFEL